MSKKKSRNVGNHSGDVMGLFGKWVAEHEAKLPKMTATEIKEKFDKTHRCNIAIGTMTSFLKSYGVVPKRRTSSSRSGGARGHRSLIRVVSLLIDDIEQQIGIEPGTIGIEPGTIGKESGAREALALMRSGKPEDEVTACFRKELTRS